MDDIDEAVFFILVYGLVVTIAATLIMAALGL